MTRSYAVSATVNGAPYRFVKMYAQKDGVRQIVVRVLGREGKSWMKLADLDLGLVKGLTSKEIVQTTNFERSLVHPVHVVRS
jgi:hypothetical protein